MRSLEASIRIKTKSAAAETNTSMPKNALIRLAKSLWKNSDIFRPVCATQGRNCQYVRIRPRKQRIKIDCFWLHRSLLGAGERADAGSRGRQQTVFDIRSS